MTRPPIRPLAGALALLLILAPAFASAAVPTTVTAQGDGVTVPTDTADPTVPTPATPSPDPIIIVRGYTTDPDRLLVGSTFTLELELYNATARTARNCYVALGGGEAVMPEAAATAGSGIVVMGTGNVRFLGTLAGRDADSVTFDLLADPRGGPGVYSLPVTVSYEYNGVRSSFAQTIGLVLNRDASFSVIAAEVPAEAIVGGTFDVSIEAANQSLFAVGGVTFSLESTGATLADAAVQIGSMEAGSSEFIDSSVTPTTAGPVQLVFVVRYRDDLDQPKEFRQTFTVDVSEAPEPDEGEPVDGEEPAEEGPGGIVGFFMALFGLGH